MGHLLSFWFVCTCTASAFKPAQCWSPFLNGEQHGCPWQNSLNVHADCSPASCAVHFLEGYRRLLSCGLALPPFGPVTGRKYHFGDAGCNVFSSISGGITVTAMA